eukprot:Platyproteum_vivax@DN10208_c0_g1_i1.p1
MESMLKAYKIVYRRFDGSMNLQQRRTCVEWFTKTAADPPNLLTEATATFLAKPKEPINEEAEPIANLRRSTRNKKRALDAECSEVPSAAKRKKHCNSDTGDTDENMKKDVEDTPSEKPGVEPGKILLVSLKAGGVGLNLVSACRVYLTDLWWNPAVEAQAMERVHRLGQTNPVHVYKLCIKDSIEEKMLELQNKKDQAAQSVLGRTSDKPEATNKQQKREMRLNELRRLFDGGSGSATTVMYGNQTLTPQQNSSPQSA